VDAIVEAMSGVPGVYVLDREMDADHNRSVVTLAGEPEAVAEAALRGTGKAMELIDLTKHTGAHPRVGATDVLPFIPIEGVTIEDCVALARRVERKSGRGFAYRYFFMKRRPRGRSRQPGKCAAGPVRGTSRRVEEESRASAGRRRAKAASDGGRDGGGARKFLIAYNVNLNTSDVSIANKIAKAIRYSSGGLRYVKSMAWT